jgi:hypothetical protein
MRDLDQGARRPMYWASIEWTPSEVTRSPGRMLSSQVLGAAWMNRSSRLVDPAE